MKLVVALIVCLGLTAYTSFKLHRMTRVLHASSVAHQVVRMTVEPGRRSRICFFWAPERIQADCDYWDNVRVGENIRIITLDGDQYIQDGDLYTSTGNFVFDIVLLVVEVIGVIFCVVLLFLRKPPRVRKPRRVRKRRQVRSVDRR